MGHNVLTVRARTFNTIDIVLKLLKIHVDRHRIRKIRYKKNRKQINEFERIEMGTNRKKIN